MFVPFYRYVKLNYRSIRSLEKIESQLIKETSNLKYDFIELLLYTKDEGVLMTGKMTDDKAVIINYNLLLFNFIYRGGLSQRNCIKLEKAIGTSTYGTNNFILHSANEISLNPPLYL